MTQNPIVPVPRRSSVAARATLLLMFSLSLAACEAGLTSGSGTSADADGGLGAGTAGLTGASYGATDPGSKAIQRLNKLEYNNAVHDLTGTTQTPAAQFPLDETYNNFDNISDVLSVSPTLLTSFVAAAISIGDEVTQAAGDASKKDSIYLKVAPCGADKDTSNCLAQTANRFGALAWRRPLSTDESNSLVSIGKAAGGDLPAQIGALVAGALTSPYFLFRVELDATPDSPVAHGLNSYELASRLSFFLWRSGPDEALLASAKNGTLANDNGLRAEVSRMLADARAQSLITGFANRWLLLNGLYTQQPDPAVFTGFNEDIRSGMSQETNAFLQDYILGGLPLSQMLTADYTYLNDTTAAWYGLPQVNSSTPVKVQLPASSGRKGLLTQGAVLISGSTGAGSSPIRRGKLIMAQLLCSSPPPPPVDVPALPTNLAPGSTRRQALAQHTADPVCNSCHVNMDPLGFAFENFDGAGKLRSTDNGSPVDTTGKYFQEAPFAGAPDLTPMIAADERLSSCTARMMLGYALGRLIQKYDTVTLDALSADFSKKDLDVRELINDIVLSASFRSRRGLGAAQ